MSLITTRFSVIKKLVVFTLLPTLILLTTSIISGGKDGLKIGKKLPLSSEKMKQHATDANYSMPYLMDVDNRLADACGAKTTPHVFMFDSADKLVYKGRIDNSWDTKRESLEKYLEIAIENLEQEKKIKENSTAPRECSIKRKK
jgi:hypothetical protein